MKSIMKSLLLSTAVVLLITLWAVAASAQTAVIGSVVTIAADWRQKSEFRCLDSYFYVHNFCPAGVDFGSGQGRREVETAGVAALRRGFQPSENAGLGRKMPFVDGHCWRPSWLT